MAPNRYGPRGTGLHAHARRTPGDACRSRDLAPVCLRLYPRARDAAPGGTRMTQRRDEDSLPLSKVPPVAEDVRRELEFHIEQRAAELVAQGMSREQAAATAREAFGDRAAVEEECRKIETRRRDTRRRVRGREAFRQDVVVGLRVLR